MGYNSMQFKILEGMYECLQLLKVYGKVFIFNKKKSIVICGNFRLLKIFEDIDLIICIVC